VRSLRVGHVAHRPVFRLVIANTGNVVEWLRRGRVEVSLVRRGRVLARLHSPARELLPRTVGVFELPYRGGIRGRATGLVALAAPGGRATTLRRSFRIR